MIRRHPRSTQGRSSAASDVYKRQLYLSDRDAWQASYERLRSLEPRRVYVGHGEPFAGQALARIYPGRYQFRWWVR